MKTNENKSFWRMLGKALLIMVLIVSSVLVIALVISYNSHTKKLKEEQQYLVAPGEMVNVTVDGEERKIHVINKTADAAAHTLVFLHPNKITDGSIALRPLFDELEGYNLIYADRSGYGFSDDTDAEKNIDDMLEETRLAVSQVSDAEKYVLVAEKSAGSLALYWANQYPDEVEAIIGLGMYFPEQYEDIDDNEYGGMNSRIMLMLVKAGAHRYASSVYYDNPYDLYTEREMNTRNALISKGLYTDGMYSEDKAVVKDSKKVAKLPFPEELNMYMIYPNPFKEPYINEDEEAYETLQMIKEDYPSANPVEDYNKMYKDIASQHTNIEITEVSSPERLETYKPKQVAELIVNYLENMDKDAD